jgi:hypothetical protein
MRLHVVVLFLSSLVALGGVARGWQPSTGNSSEIWGGRGVTMRMTGQGAMLEFDCAHGSITQPIKPDAKGEFRGSGTYTAERGGPVLKADQPHDIPAMYRGVIDGDSMRLEIVVSDKDQSPAPLTLTRGNAGRLVKCR